MGDEKAEAVVSGGREGAPFFVDQEGDAHQVGLALTK